MTVEIVTDYFLRRRVHDDCGRAKWMSWHERDD